MKTLLFKAFTGYSSVVLLTITTAMFVHNEEPRVRITFLLLTIAMITLFIKSLKES